MNNLKKLAALMMALVMVLAMGTGFATSSAADMTGEKGVLGEFTSADTPDAQGNSVKLYKEITAYNEETIEVSAPTITYEYTITAGEEGAKVKDAGGASLHASGAAVEVQTKAGLTTGATITGTESGKIVLTSSNSAKLKASANGEANRFPLTVDFSRVTWTGAGVYRYVITETTTVGTKNAAGINDGTISDTRYLDVYVKDGESSGYEIYGYVCFQELKDIDGTDASSVTAVAKTEGFVSDKKDDGTTDHTADEYFTFNLTVSKTLVGDQAMNDHDFPFSVALANSGVTTDVTIIKVPYEGTTKGTEAGLNGKLSAEGGVVDNPKINNGSSVKYIGIPVGITAATTGTVYETNDVMGTTYASDFTVDGATVDNSKKSITWESTDDANKSVVATLGTLTAATGNTTARIVAFTNTLEIISPTGYVARIAPYALMLAAGVVLLVLFLKRRKVVTEDDE